MTSVSLLLCESVQAVNLSIIDWLTLWLEPQTLVQIFGIIFLIVSLRQAYFSISANTYIQVMEKINNSQNDENVKKLRNYLETLSTEVKSDASLWSKDERDLANILTNSYQIVAHMVERQFLSKVLFIENFSGTLMDVYNMCAPHIALKRIEAVNKSLLKKSQLSYLRRDLERLGLQSWIYQVNLGFGIQIHIIKDDYSVEILQPDDVGIEQAKTRIRQLSRRSLTYEWFRLRKLRT